MQALLRIDMRMRMYFQNSCNFFVSSRSKNDKNVEFRSDISNDTDQMSMNLERKLLLLVKWKHMWWIIFSLILNFPCIMYSPRMFYFLRRANLLHSSKLFFLLFTKSFVWTSNQINCKLFTFRHPVALMIYLRIYEMAITFYLFWKYFLANHLWV